ETAPAYRGPWKRGQRCILPVEGFYEWHTPESGPKQPYYIYLAGHAPFGFAGLWDESRADDGTAVRSCTLVTVPANPLMAQIHNTRQRMPAIVTPDTAEQWLRGEPAAARSLLVPFPADQMDAYRVSTRVNSPRNQGPELIEPVR